MLSLSCICGGIPGAHETDEGPFELSDVCEDIVGTREARRRVCEWSVHAPRDAQTGWSCEEWVGWTREAWAGWTFDANPRKAGSSVGRELNEGGSAGKDAGSEGVREARVAAEKSEAATMALVHGRTGEEHCGQQLTSLCRYGHLSVCGLKLAEFKSFMSLKGLHPEECRNVWILRRAEWQVRRRMEKSSEDVMSGAAQRLPA
ncbi:uncharacterized protein C8Q71DRAFT_851811 [Rhodofomes roseus]|uniref:Uncharacterized protein n=1 Tax=Rhodofomes roseus TaxID=34475 RepID=A0ABQ8JYL9_9APHY|nr:uncharacterized protein C8Q71DRAFT_851811 [Rhodofomes roseus]KAH9829263.1 hypothetical protein C8Q71DRAFT_851811 [Rhodofomes roseus]